MWVIFRVRTETAVEVAEDLFGEKWVLSLEAVGGRVEEDLDEVGLDHTAPETFKKVKADS